MHLKPALPPAGIVIVGRHFRDDLLGALLAVAELLVVVGSDPLERVERSRLERAVDLVFGDRDRLGAKRLEYLAGEAANPNLQAAQILRGADFLAEPARHLAPGIAGRQRKNLAVGEKFVDQGAAAPFGEPGFVLPRIHAERRRGGEYEARILAPIIG